MCTPLRSIESFNFPLFNISLLDARKVGSPIKRELALSQVLVLRRIYIFKKEKEKKRRIYIFGDVWKQDLT